MLVKILTFFIILISFNCISAEEVTLAYVEFPPYEFQERGEAKGILVDIVKMIFTRANIPLRLVYRPFKRALNSTKLGKINGLFNFFKTESRLKSFDYSDSVIKNPLIYFVRKDSKIRINHIEDLKGLRVGIMLGYTYGTTFDESTHFIKESGTSHIGNLKKLLFDRIDIYPCDKLVCMYVAMKNNFLGSFKLLRAPLRIMDGYIGFTKGKNQKIIKQINIELEKMHKNGEMDKMINKYVEAI